jgi:nucleoside-diphosphate-sugar epimerase
VGRILEEEYDGTAGFVNHYERSKFEAETLVRASDHPWVIIRPSTIVCDSLDGCVSQFNAVHRSLRLFHSGLAPMLPGADQNPVDVVTAEYVADCVSALTLAAGVEGGTFHLCAGGGAMELGRVLELAYATWAESDEWRRRAISLPALTDLDTYGLFEQTVDDSEDARLRTITKSLTHFVPQLALPKRFDVSRTIQVTGREAPKVSDFWKPMLRHLLRSRWAASARRAA